MCKKPKIRARKNLAKDVETKPTPPIRIPPRQQVDNQMALKFLDSIIALAPVNRQTHIQAQQATQQIGRALQSLKEKPDVGKQQPA